MGSCDSRGANPVIDTDSLCDLVRDWRQREYERLPKTVRAVTPEPSPEVSEGLARCAWVLLRTYRGAHHVPGRPRVQAGAIEVTHYAQMATADSNALTRLVVFAHEAGVRVAVEGVSRRYLRITLSPRTRSPLNTEGHPTIEDNIANLSVGGPCPIPVPESPHDH